jgi:hypothetical protein
MYRVNENLKKFMIEAATTEGPARLAIVARKLRLLLQAKGVEVCTLLILSICQ